MSRESRKVLVLAVATNWPQRCFNESYLLKDAVILGLILSLEAERHLLANFSSRLPEGDLMEKGGCRSSKGSQCLRTQILRRLLHMHTLKHKMTAWGDHQNPHKNKRNKYAHSSEDSKPDKNELNFRATEPERKEFIISPITFLCFLSHMMTGWWQ